jgi:hypothetical protein
MEKTTPMNNAFHIHNAIFAILVLGSGRPAIAETDIPHPSYTWSLTPTSNDWDTPANWNAEGMPDYDEQATTGTPAPQGTSQDEGQLIG